MLPFKVQQLVDIIIQKKNFNLEDALNELRFIQSEEVSEI